MVFLQIHKNAVNKILAIQNFFNKMIRYMKEEKKTFLSLDDFGPKKA